jgi:Rubredoxin-like zinc ribbon domain (DUF35_N)
MPEPARAKPVPAPTPTTQPYWDGTAVGELRIQRCVTTGKVFSYPRRFFRPERPETAERTVA